MNAITVIEGQMVPLDRADIDTDQIMPKQFLKRIERTGFGEFVFYDWRRDPGFILNDPRYEDANVLIAGPNFGCGSSREHAPWGLQQYGFEAVIAPSFADIFRVNCSKIGLLTVPLSVEACRTLSALATEDPQAIVRIDLVEQSVTSAAGAWTFDVDPFTKHCLVNGLDDIGLTLEHAAMIASYEARRAAWMPRTVSF